MAVQGLAYRNITKTEVEAENDLDNLEDLEFVNEIVSEKPLADH